MDDIKLTVNNIRVLSAEMIEEANSGHPGLPLGCAAVGYSLYANILKHNPGSPGFFDRDRFVLSAGHGSALIYSLLHIFGYDLKMEDIKNFRQFGSPAAGHPERGHVPGVEVSTGPLGQGIANAVGMAIAETMLAARFNREGIEVINHYTYALAGDGCMMEGIESEAASLAGTLKLGKLIVFYDSNKITIEGSTDLAFAEDVGLRHEAQGWQVLRVASGEDTGAIIRAAQEAKRETRKPTLIIVSTRIGEGSPNAGSAEMHGSPLGVTALNQMKQSIGWTEPPFTVAAEVKKHISTFAPAFKKYEDDWKAVMAQYAEKYPDEHAQLTALIRGDAPELGAEIWQDEKTADATRNSGGIVLNKIAKAMPFLVGGAADLAPSTKTFIKGAGEYSADSRGGRNIHYGIREHAMAAAANGIAGHGGLTTFCSTFLVFSDYMRNSIRLSAIMNLPVTYIFTHDSIGVGEDGPTHQPIEHVSSLRLIPGLDVFRPADYRETAAAYISAVNADRPTAIILSRQNLPALDGSGEKALSGGYILKDTEGAPDIIIIATGSETHLATQAAEKLAADGVKARVVSMPCAELFDRQSAEYRQSVLPKNVRCIAVEAGSTPLWHKYTGAGAVIGIDTFGASGKSEKLFEHYGITVENIVLAAKKAIG